MTTLHISHTVRDLDEWLETFKAFDAFRAEGGVTSCTVRHGVDEPRFVAVDLTFDSTDAARAFGARLASDVWPASPHLEGTPSVRILEPVA